MEYIVARTPVPPPLDAPPGHPAWAPARVGEVATFLDRSSDHRPRTHFRVMYDDRGLYVMFTVDDRYVRAEWMRPQESVCKDSCVEFFVQPHPDRGYFNFELNCVGTILLYYIEDHTGSPGGKRTSTPVDPAHLAHIKIWHELQGPIVNEIASPCTWRVSYHVPFALFEDYAGPLGTPTGHAWRANFYKCGDNTSHPHWASWAPIDGIFNFHLPQYFAPLRFAP